MIDTSSRHLLLPPGNHPIHSQAERFAEQLGLSATPIGLGDSGASKLTLGANDIFLGVLGRHLVAANGMRAPTPPCLECLMATVALKTDLREREAHTLRDSPETAPTLQPNPFALGLVHSLLSWATAPCADSSVWLVYADLSSLTVESSVWPLEAMCERCTSGAGSDLPAPYRLQKLSPGEYRGRRLTDFQIAPGQHTNRLTGQLGDGIFHNRASPFSALAQASFNGPKGTKAELSWFGSADSYASSRSAGLLEGIERRAGARLPTTQETLLASFAELAESAIDPRDLGLYDDTVYGTDPRLRKFDASVPLSWVQCTDLRSSRTVYVPTDFVFYGTPQLVFGNSSGCASGSSGPEAILHALMELVERDAFLLHWYARLTARRIKLESLHDLECRTLVARLRSQGLELMIFDLRVDLPFPVVLAVALGNRDAFGAFSVATGASMDPISAARKAIQEVSILNHGFEARSRKAANGRLKNAPKDFSLIRSMDDHALLYGNPVMRPTVDFLIDSAPNATFADCFDPWISERPESLDLSDDVRFVQDVLASRGYPTVLYFDQTMHQGAKLGVSTARVIVPGLLPIDFGHARCRAANLPRLYDVPYHSGRVDRPLLRSDVNPAPHPFA